VAKIDPNKNIPPYISDYAPEKCRVNESVKFMAVVKSNKYFLDLETVYYPFIAFGNQNILYPVLKENSIIFGIVPPSHIPQTVNLYCSLS